MQRKRGKKRSLWWVSAVFVTILVWMNWPQKSSSNHYIAKAPSQNYSEGELHSFWDMYLEQPIHQSLLNQGIHPISEIRGHYGFLSNEVLRKYGRAFQVNYSPTYDPASRSVVGANKVVAGQPIIYIIVPAIYDQYLRWRMMYPENFTKRTVNSVVITVLHELEHLYLDTSENPPGSYSELVDSEADTWFMTCRDVLSVFVRNGEPISPSDGLTYASWLKCGQTTGPCWTNEIRVQYAEVAGSFR